MLKKEFAAHITLTGRQLTIEKTYPCNCKQCKRVIIFAANSPVLKTGGGGGLLFNELSTH